MSDLSDALSKSGFEQVSTYIQSGNVVFSSQSDDVEQLAKNISVRIKQRFDLDVDTVVISKAEWKQIIHDAPSWWGVDEAWKHNLLVLLQPYDMQKTIEAIGTLKPDIEMMQPGKGVIYQSMSKALFGRTTTGKIASSPIYKRMTVRNYNTAHKILDLLK